MFKRSLLILLFCGLLSLAGIVAYALLGWHGPEDTLREAQSKLAAGRYSEVIADLDQAELGHSISNNRALRVQLWKMRKEAYARLGIPAGALADVRNLLANGQENDTDLLLDQIRFLASDKQGDLARIAAKRFLETHPEHHRGLELAGEACQTAYQPLLRDLLATIDRELGFSKREEAREILLTFLYRPNGDRMVQRSGVRLEEFFHKDAQLQLRWPTIWSDAQLLRDRIQESLGFYQASLDLGGEPVAAFRAIATALEQSGRIDDLLFACEIQRRMFDHAYVMESGVLASWVRIQHHSAEGAIATTERWLPEDQIAARAKDGTLPATAEQLALARALAAWQLRDAAQIRDAAKMVGLLRTEGGFKAGLALQLSQASRRLIANQQDALQIETHLRRVVDAAIREPAPLRRPDFVAEFAPILIDSLIQRNAGEEETLQALAMWREGRPEAIAPVLRTAEYLLTLGRTASALAAVAEARALDPEHPDVFPLHLRIARRHNESSQQDGDSLLMQCINNRKLLPDARDPIGFALCAEAALSQNDRKFANIALACARSAIGSFPRANIPRQLELRALLLQRDYQEASRTATLTIAAMQPNATTLALAIRAKQLAGDPTRDLMRMAMPRVRENADMQAELLRLALADSPSTADRFITSELTDAAAPLATRILVIRALTTAGRLADALAQMEALPVGTAADPTTASLPPQTAEQGQLATAFAEWLLANAASHGDAELLPILQTQHRRLDLAAGPQQPLLLAAAKLVDSHPRTAFAILNVGLPAALPEERTGKLYIMAGDLALSQNDTVRAEACWTAALGFADGQVIAERLARLLLLLEREERARKVYALATHLTDGALAARFGQSAIGATLLAQALQREPVDLIVHAALKTFGQPTMVDWAPATDVESQKLRLELLAGLNDPLLGMLCLPRAELQLRSDPKSKTNSLLLARSLANAGKAPAAGFLHAELLKAGYINPVLWHEVAYAGKHADYVTSNELMQQVMGAATSGRTGGSSLTLAFGLKEIVKAFEKAGMTDVAKTTRLSQWLATPQVKPCTKDDLALIVAGHSPANVCLILAKVLSAPHECDRRAVLQQFYLAAAEVVRTDPSQAKPLTALANRHLASEGAHGEIVHFLLAHTTQNEPLTKKQMLLGHLEMIAQGRNDTSLLDATITELGKAIGDVATDQAIDNLLNRYPTALSLWAVRVSLRWRLDSDPAALQELRTVLSHATDPEAVLAFLSLAATERQLQVEDLGQLQKLPQPLLASPRGQYVQAIIALRQGNAKQAIEHFQTAAPQQDGRHLFELAMARLQSNAPDSIPQAIASLQQLQADYPRSSLSRHAGSFVRQLSPRKANASDSDEKR